MLKQINFSENPMSPDDWETHFAMDVRDFLIDKFGDRLPDTGRIYHEQVALDHDVTPHDEASIERLGELDGPFYVVIYPHDPITLIVSIIAVAAVAASFALAPPAPALRNTQSESPNNELSARENRPRVGGRIPEIYGTVTSTPDLIAVPYSEYIDHQEVEHAYMCIGRGSYDISADNVRDGETRLNEIAGTSAAIYGPGTSPNGGSAQLTIGDPISELVLKATRSNAVNGQELLSPNVNTFNGTSNVKFVSPNQIVTTASGVDFSDLFSAGSAIDVSGAVYSEITGSGSTDTPSAKFTSTGTIVYDTGSPSFGAGDVITVSQASFLTELDTIITLDGVYTVSSVSSTTITLSNPSSVNSAWNSIAPGYAANETNSDSVTISSQGSTSSVNLFGTYTVTSSTATTITLSNPSGVNSDWNDLTNFTNNETGLISPQISSTGTPWVGPFTLDVVDLDLIYLNFIALNGLYKDDGEQQFSFDVSVLIEATPVDASGTPTGSAQTTTGTLAGSATTQSTRALTVKFNPSFTGRCKVRVRRTTDSDVDFEGTVIDAVKWRDLYAMSPVSATDFGDVTTVQALTYATSGALAVKSRRRNRDVTRKLPSRVSGDQFTTALTATNSAADIISAIALDPKIGNRKKAEIDFDSIYDTISEVQSYFGTTKAGEFNYTFDSDNFSFEETIATVAAASFCTAFRRGNVLKLSFEKATQNSTLLFNHRNKLPGSETRTVQFGGLNDQDGVEYEYVNETDGSLATLTVPFDVTPNNPRKVESVGVRNYEQAYLHAWRIWGKIEYQNIAVDFGATQEADLLVLNDRILVADNTRSGTQDGEVIAQDGLTLTLSQDITFETGETYTIFLQHIDGTVESISITAGGAANQVTLGTAPKASLSVAVDNFARATYQIVKDSSEKQQAFLVDEKSPRDNFTSNVKAINYADEYYLHDELLLWLPVGSSLLIDKSAHGRSITAQGTATTATDSVRGVVYSSGASAGRLDTGLTAAASYTKAAWVNVNTLGDNGSIISSIASDEQLIYDGTNIVVKHFNTALSDSTMSAAYTGAAGEWVHVAATYDVDEAIAKIYINGALVASEGNFNQRTNLSALQIGAHVNGTNWNGKIDDVRYYKRALIASEILSIYRKTKG